MLNLDVSKSVSRNFGGSWTHRRRIIYCTLIFCAFCIVFIMFYGSDTKLHEAIVSSAFLLAGGVIGSYVFGAVWDDKNPVAIDNTSAATNDVPAGALIGGTANVDDPDGD